MKKILMVLTLLSVLVCCGVVSASDPAASVVITPQNPQMEVGQSITVTAQGYDINNNPVQIHDPNWEWDPQYGTLTVDANNPCQASFQATAPGDGYALCYEGPGWQGGPSGSTDIKITTSQLAQIIVTPATVTMLVGQQQQFTATGKDKNGNTYQITPIWSTNGGTIDQNGNYDATVPGDFTVTASVQGSTVTGTGSVEAKPAPYLVSIVVTPNNKKVECGSYQLFSATGYDQYGNVFPINPVWTTTSAAADISQDGFYKASQIGKYTIIAVAEGISGTASVEVIPFSGSIPGLGPVFITGRSSGAYEPTSFRGFTVQSIPFRQQSNSWIYNPLGGSTAQFYGTTSQDTSTQSAITPATPTAQQDITSSPLLYLGGALVAVLAVLGIYKLM